MDQVMMHSLGPESCCMKEKCFQEATLRKHSRAGTCWPVEGKVSASRVRLSHTGEAASLAARLFLPCVTASLPAQHHITLLCISHA